jgi:hypothetical protein
MTLQLNGLKKKIKMNTKVTWLLEDAVFEENIDTLKTELTRQGISFESIKHIPLESDKYKNPKGVDNNGCVLVYGSLNLMRQLLREKSWIPCGYCTLKNFECSKYYTYFGKFLLNQDYMMIPALELLRQKEFIYDKMGVDGCIFVRPSSGFKEFAGATVPFEDMNKNTLGFGFYHENPELLTVVTTSKIITKEWRFVVAKKKVITGSQYRLGKDVEPELVETTCEAALYAQSIVDAVEWEPDPIYTLDVCESNGELFLLELNGFSTSGLYDCDLEIIVRVASKMAEEDWANTHG